MFELFLFDAAKNFLEGLEVEERRQVARLLDILKFDPWVDGVHKFHIPMYPVISCVYYDTKFSIIYRIHGNTKVSIDSIAFTGATSE